MSLPLCLSSKERELGRNKPPFPKRRRWFILDDTNKHIWYAIHIPTMKPNLNNVEIQEPPLETIKKKRSCLKQSCWGGCGCLVLVCIALAVLLKFVLFPAPQEIKIVPEQVSAALPVYDEDNIDRITRLSAERRQKSLRILAYAPKILLAPIVALLDRDTPKAEDAATESTEKQVSDFLDNLTGDDRDIITIEWQDLSAEASFIESFYKKELTKRSFAIKDLSEEAPTEFLFYKKNPAIDGILTITDRPDADGTNLLLLTVHIPNQQ